MTNSPFDAAHQKSRELQIFPPPFISVCCQGPTVLMGVTQAVEAPQHSSFTYNLSSTSFNYYWREIRGKQFWFSGLRLLTLHFRLKPMPSSASLIACLVIIIRADNHNHILKWVDKECVLYYKPAKTELVFWIFSRPCMGNWSQILRFDFHNRLTFLLLNNLTHRHRKGNVACTTKQLS